MFRCLDKHMVSSGDGIKQNTNKELNMTLTQDLRKRIDKLAKWKFELECRKDRLTATGWEEYGIVLGKIQAHEADITLLETAIQEMETTTEKRIKDFGEKKDWDDWEWGVCYGLGEAIDTFHKIIGEAKKERGE